MICINTKFPDNCTVCPFNIQGCCVASGIVDNQNQMIYRDIDVDFGEGLESRPDWCNIQDDSAVIDKMLHMITIEDVDALVRLGQSGKQKEVNNGCSQENRSSRNTIRTRQENK